MKTMLRHAALIVLALAAAGCQRTIVREPLAIDGLDPNDAGKQLDFWHSLPGRSAVTNNEGLHGLILLAEGKDESQNYDQRVAYAIEKGWLPAGFSEQGDLAMQRGTLARAVAVSQGIKGGVMMRLTNSHARYAERELEYLRIMGPGTALQAVSGLDYVGVVSKAQDYTYIEQARAETGQPRARVLPVPPRDQNTSGVGTPPSGTEQPAGEPAPAPSEPPANPPTEAPAPPASDPPGSVN